MGILIIELIWVIKYEKMGEKPPFWEISKGGTGTKQSGSGTISVLSTGTSTGTGTGTQCSILDQCSYFGHTLVISCPI